jgi:hypothetical protein
MNRRYDRLGEIFRFCKLLSASRESALIVWLAMRRQGIARKQRSTLNLARHGVVAMDSRGRIITALEWC